MEKDFDLFLEACENLKSKGEDFCVVTIVDAKGSIPQNIGAKMIAANSVVYFGTVGGGKVEAKALEVAIYLLKSSIHKSTEFHKWNLQKDVGMT